MWNFRNPVTCVRRSQQLEQDILIFKASVTLRPPRPGALESLGRNYADSGLHTGQGTTCRTS
jgi:hypothetical protein